MSRRGYVHHDLETIFFWSQKSACTTLFLLLSENFGHNNHYYHSNSKDWKECLKIIDRKGYKSVVIARHPIQRMVSAYINKFVMYGRRPLLRIEDLQEFARDLYQDFITLRDGQVTGGWKDENEMSFQWFTKTVRHLHSIRNNSNRGSINGHWDSQVPPIFLDIGFHYDRVMRVEDLTSDLGEFCREYGLSYSKAAGNQSKVVPHSESCERADHLKPRELVGKNLSHAAFLSPEACDIFRELFWMDFEMFDYPFEVNMNLSA